MNDDLTNPKVLARRRPVWKALSDLCLDTELDDVGYKYIARTIHENGFTIEEAEHIAYNEVFPAVFPNLFSVAGEWAFFDPVWLEKRIFKALNNKPSSFHLKIRQWFYRRNIGDDWEKVAGFYQSGDFQPLSLT